MGWLQVQGCLGAIMDFSSLSRLWPDLQKPNIIAQYRIFSVKLWIHWVNICVFWKKSVDLFTCLVLGEGRSQQLKPWLSSYLLKQEELENLCLIVVHQRSCKVWLFVYVPSKRLLAINVSSWISTFLWQCRGAEGITYPIIHFSVHGEHDGANFESMHHSIRMLHPF